MPEPEPRGLAVDCGASARASSRAVSFERVARLALLAGCGLGAGCERSDAPLAPAWISLARGFRPASVEALNAAWARIEPPVAVRPDESGKSVWVDYRIEPSGWHRLEAKAPRSFEDWWAERPASGSRPREGERVELRLEGRAIVQHQGRSLRKLEEQGDPEGDYFFLDPERIRLRRPAGKGPPSAGVYSLLLERGHEQNGIWRATVEMLVGDGLTLWPGESVELVRDVPSASALRFVTVAHRLGNGGEVLFRVLLDGKVLLEHAQDTEQASAVSHVLALPPDGRAAAHLAFEVRGPPAISAFLEPLIGPAAIGAYDARPWTERRPDLVVFLADTFRADNLAAYGAPPDLCPELNRLGERSVRFLRARSASVWTLPSHGAMFTGLYPPQHGALERGLTFPAELVTLAEHLEGAGYRTGAVTDSGFVSRYFGLDQGFGWFQEQDFLEHRLRNTLAWADDFLARDDGRPVFLFVHTYRTHTPYRQGADESDAELRSFMRKVRDAALGPDKKLDHDTLNQALRSFLPEYLELYRGGAHALDAAFGPWFESCERRGLFKSGYLVFTSDHGEAFFEHGAREHSGRPHEEKVRIPLFLFGSGLAPRDVLFGAHHIDLAPTLSALAGLEPVPGWVGTPLFELDQERVLFSYNQDDRGAYLATIEGEQKLLESAKAGVRPRGVFDEAYWLATDPLERENLAAAELPWTRDLSARSVALLDGFFQRMREPATVELPEELRVNLEALGYGE